MKYRLNTIVLVHSFLILQLTLCRYSIEMMLFERELCLLIMIVRLWYRVHCVVLVIFYLLVSG